MQIDGLVRLLLFVSRVGSVELKPARLYLYLEVWYSLSLLWSCTNASHPHSLIDRATYVGVTRFNGHGEQEPRDDMVSRK